jgi:hypothetical protein
MPIIGRTTPADILISEPQVSSRHAEIRHIGGDQFLLTDLGSTNGTYVNDQRIQSATIRLSDRVRLGMIPIDLTKFQNKILQQSSPNRQSRSSSDRKSMPVFLPALLIIAIIATVAVGLLYATRQTIIKRCEICSREIFNQSALFYEVDSIRAEASKFRWCKEDGDAPIAVKHISRCEYCAKVIEVREETRPRREEPKGSDLKAGYCSDQCRLLAAGRDIYKEGKEVIGDTFSKGTDALRELTDRLKK